METIHIGSQVLVRSVIPTGNLIRYGEVVAIQGSSAQIFFPNDRVRKTLPLNQLELTSKRYIGMSRVQTNPLKRGL